MQAVDAVVDQLEIGGNAAHYRRESRRHGFAQRAREAFVGRHQREDVGDLEPAAHLGDGQASGESDPRAETERGGAHPQALALRSVAHQHQQRRGELPRGGGEASQQGVQFLLRRQASHVNRHRRLGRDAQPGAQFEAQRRRAGRELGGVDGVGHPPQLLPAEARRHGFIRHAGVEDHHLRHPLAQPAQFQAAQERLPHGGDQAASGDLHHHGLPQQPRHRKSRGQVQPLHEEVDQPVLAALLPERPGDAQREDAVEARRHASAAENADGDAAGIGQFRGIGHGRQTRAEDLDAIAAPHQFPADALRFHLRTAQHRRVGVADQQQGDGRCAHEWRLCLRL